jgi:hypothetical protein
MFAQHQTTSNTNINTRVGQWGARSTIADANNRVIVPNPFYGALANDQTNINVFTDSTAISQSATQPLAVVDTFSTGFDTGATFGSYLPGGCDKSLNTHNEVGGWQPRNGPFEDVATAYAVWGLVTEHSPQWLPAYMEIGAAIRVLSAILQ